MDPTLEAVMASIAQTAVDDIVDSVVSGIRSGDIKIHKPKSMWGLTNHAESQRSPDKLAKVNAMKKYNRITEIMSKAHRDHEDPAILIERAGFLPEDLDEYQKSQNLHLRFKERMKFEKRAAEEKERKLMAQKEKEIRKFQAEQARVQAQHEEMKRYQARHRETRKLEYQEQRLKKQQLEKEKVKQVKRFLKKHQPQVPLHKRMEQEFKEQILLPQLKKEREILEARRAERAEPINRDLLAEHERNYRQKAEIMARAKRREHELAALEAPVVHYEVNKEAYQRMMQKDRREQQKKLHQAEIARAKMEARLSYGDAVKTRYKPHVDPSKAAEVEKHKRLLEEKKKPKGLSYEELKEIKKNADKYVRPDHNPVAPLKLKSRYTEELREKERKRQQKLAQKPIDYLHKDGPSRGRQHRKEIKQRKQRKEKLAGKLSKLEKKIAKKEAREEEIQDPKQSVAHGKDVNDDYLDMIKTKLELLDENHKDVEKSAPMSARSNGPASSRNKKKAAEETTASPKQNEPPAEAEPSFLDEEDSPAEGDEDAQE